jgi:EmrB/QacA subfamily drug resistance transporter
MFHGHGTRAHAVHHAAGADVAAPSSAKLERGTVLALVAMGLGTLVIANDFTALNVALTAIEGDFDVDLSTAQWVINAYALSFGMAIVAGGRLADMFGRRRIFFIGTTIFITCSALGGFAQNIEWLIASRVAMGIGGALMWPAILGMVFAALPASKASFAGAFVLGVAGLGNSLGPLLGGFLTDELSWRWIFFLNVPIGLFAMWVTARFVHQTEQQEDQRVDYKGIIALSVALVALLIAFDQAPDWGWGDWRVIALLAISILSITGFGFIEGRVGKFALIPADIIRHQQLRIVFLVVLLMSSVFFTTLLYVPQFMEKILGYSAFGAGVGMLAMLIPFTGFAFAAGPLYERLGPKPVLLTGAAGLAIGPLLLALLVDSSSGYSALVPGLVVTGIGVGLFYPSVTTLAVTSLDPSRASLAGGLVYMTQIAGGAIGLGLATSIFTIRSENVLSSDAADASIQLNGKQEAVLHGDLAGTDQAASALMQLPGKVMNEIVQIVADSFTAGTTFTLVVVGGIAIVGFLVVLLRIHGERPGATADGGPPASEPSSSTPEPRD